MQVALNAKASPKLDVVAFDACDVASAEVAYEFAPYADFLLASEVGVPIPGWPYDTVLKRLRAPFGRPMTPVELGTWVVNRFCQRYESSRAVSLSMLDLTRAGDLSDRVQVLAAELRRYIGLSGANREQIADIFYRSVTEIDRPYVDVADLALNLAREVADHLVIEASRALGDFIIVPKVTAISPYAYPFVCAHGRNAGETAKLNGLSLYAPHVAPAYDSVTVRKRYKRFEFEARTAWGDLVHALVG
jgi:hypothetical protein